MEHFMLEKRSEQEIAFSEIATAAHQLCPDIPGFETSELLQFDLQAWSDAASEIVKKHTESSAGNRANIAFSLHEAQYYLGMGNRKRASEIIFAEVEHLDNIGEAEIANRLYEVYQQLK